MREAFKMLEADRHRLQAEKDQLSRVSSGLVGRLQARVAELECQVQGRLT
jgi:hypothetical protein